MHIRQAREEMALRKLDRRAQRRAIASFGKGKAGIAHLQAEVARLKGERAEAVCSPAGGCLGWRRGSASRRDNWCCNGGAGWVGRRSERNACRRGHAEADARLSARDSYREALLLLGVEAGSEPALIKRAYRQADQPAPSGQTGGAGASVERVRAATEENP
ncbi:hypothetical protein [Pseudomonas aeruginosa]|uniref:hypothetical protein n=1 Tax=Pseudomonas aeruginosa TaxID=287 RepID=UPI003D27A848